MKKTVNEKSDQEFVYIAWWYARN